MYTEYKKYPEFIRKTYNLLLRVDYDVILPFIAKYGFQTGFFLSKCRGVIQFLIDYDWRSIAIGRPYVGRDTWRAMKTIFPEKKVKERIRIVFKRFLNYAIEEWESCLFSQNRMNAVASRSAIHGVEHLRKAQREGRGVVLVSSHFGSFCMGMTLLGMNGFKTNVVNTTMIEDKRIHPSVRAFFQKKYRAMEARMNGLMAYHEIHMDYFYEALQKGEIVVLLVDTQGSKSSVYIPFLNRRFRMPLGAWRMARSTGSLLGAYVCLRHEPDKYEIVLKAPVEVDNHAEPEETMRPFYCFLEQWIRKYPDQWLAAEHLMNYSDLE